MKSVFVFKTLGLSVLLSVCAIFMANTVRHTFAEGDFTEASFKKFVALFPAKELPYKIGASEMNAWIEQRKNKSTVPSAKPMQQARITDEFDSFIPEVKNAMFSRMGPDIFTPEAVLAKTDKHIILLYSRSRGYSERKGSQYLAVFSPKGKRLSEMLVAKSDGYEGFMGCKITKTQTGGVLVSTTNYVNQWKNDKARYDDDNFITVVTPKKTTSRILTPEGDLEEVLMP
jgi:hypothetical protein